MARLIWLRSARADLREIYRYIARDSAAHATATIRRIRSSAERLADFPESGRIVPEHGDPMVREVIVSPYRVAYRYFPDRDLVQVFAVFHGSTTFPDREDDG
ncbi:MAG: type II toxin-antitoxin system RelE/ParE family toxin [Dehalococcoidia bacterium]